VTQSSFPGWGIATIELRMADGPEAAVVDGPIPTEKPHLRSSTDDEVEAGEDVYTEANPARPGFTKSDQKDMWRMGRVQELKVSSNYESILD
jgi:hypothetical protein